MARVMHIMSPCVRPKRVHKQNILIVAKDFEGSRYPRVDSEKKQPSGPDRFWVTLGSLWDHFAVTLGSLRVYEGYFGVTLVRFQSVLIFPVDFNGFI